jgi:hypothetical protein
MVECNRCHERQWYTIDLDQSPFSSDVGSGGKPGLVARILIRLRTSVTRIIGEPFQANAVLPV